MRRPIAALGLAVAVAGAAAIMVGDPAQPRALAEESVESRLAAADLRIADAPIDVPGSTSEVCGMAIYDYAVGAAGPPTPREAVIERALGFGIGDEPRGGVLAPVTEGEKSASWVFVPDDGTAVITYRLYAAPGGGWIVGSSGVSC